jgi:hypothetical protein
VRDLDADNDDDSLPSLQSVSDSSEGSDLDSDTATEPVYPPPLENIAGGRYIPVHVRINAHRMLLPATQGQNREDRDGRGREGGVGESGDGEQVRPGTTPSSRAGVNATANSPSSGDDTGSDRGADDRGTSSSSNPAEIEGIVGTLSLPGSISDAPIFSPAPPMMTTGRSPLLNVFLHISHTNDASSSSDTNADVGRDPEPTSGPVVVSIAEEPESTRTDTFLSSASAMRQALPTSSSPRFSTVVSVAGRMVIDLASEDEETQTEGEGEETEDEALTGMALEPGEDFVTSSAGDDVAISPDGSPSDGGQSNGEVSNELGGRDCEDIASASATEPYRTSEPETVTSLSDIVAGAELPPTPDARSSASSLQTVNPEPSSSTLPEEAKWAHPSGEIEFNADPPFATDGRGRVVWSNAQHRLGRGRRGVASKRGGARSEGSGSAHQGQIHGQGINS